MRFPKPFFRAAKNSWYLQLGKRQLSLGADREQAFERYRQILLHENGDSSAAGQDLTVAEVADLFLEWAGKHTASYSWYKNYLQAFCDRCGGLTIAKLKPFHLNRWLDSKTWNDTTRNKVIGIIKRALNWAVAEGLLADSPLRHVRKPTVQHRDKIVTIEERRTILRSLKGKRGRALKLFLFALGQTGARPGEVRSVTAAQVDLRAGVWVFRRHKTVKRTGKPRIVYLTPPMVKLCSRLMAEYPEGPLFRNSHGQPWSVNAIRIRFRSLRRRLHLDKGVIAYAFRHTYATEGLARGVPLATMAELLGHTSAATLAAHYAHLGEKASYLREAAQAAVRFRPGCA